MNRVFSLKVEDQIDIGCQYKVGDFYLNKVNGDGIRVGCHKIGWEEIDRLAEVEGWVKGTN